MLTIWVHERPGPQLGHQHRTGVVVEARAARPAGGQHGPVGQDGGIHLAARESHRSGAGPARGRLVEIDGLTGIARRIATADHQDLAVRVLNRAAVGALQAARRCDWR